MRGWCLGQLFTNKYRVLNKQQWTILVFDVNDMKMHWQVGISFILRRAASPDGLFSVVIGEEWLVRKKLSMFSPPAVFGESTVVALESPVSGKFCWSKKVIRIFNCSPFPNWLAFFPLSIGFQLAFFLAHFILLQTKQRTKHFQSHPHRKNKKIAHLLVVTWSGENNPKQPMNLNLYYLLDFEGFREKSKWEIREGTTAEGQMALCS